MTRTRNAGFVVGRYLLPPDYDDPEGGTATGADDGADGGTGEQAPPDGPQGDETDQGTPPADPDPSSSPAGKPSGEDTGRIKQLSDEAAKYRTRAKATEDTVEQAQKTIGELRMKNAYIRYALPVVDDLDAGRKLADFGGVTIDEEGNVNGMAEAVAALVRNYPYLERQTDTQPYAPPGSGGTPNNGRRQGQRRHVAGSAGEEVPRTTAAGLSYRVAMNRRSPSMSSIVSITPPAASSLVTE